MTESEYFGKRLRVETQRLARIVFHRIRRTTVGKARRLHAYVQHACVRARVRCRYMQVLRLGRALVSHARHAADTQRALAEAFAELAQRAPHLQPEFACNADSQRTIAKNADTLIGRWQHRVSRRVKKMLNFFFCPKNNCD